MFWLDKYVMYTENMISYFPFPLYNYGKNVEKILATSKQLKIQILVKK